MRRISEHRVTHVGVAIDESTSMWSQRNNVTKAFDALVTKLANRSKELKQEVRLSVWTFADKVENIVWDIDVLRMPEIAGSYRPHGMTSLIDAGYKGIQDLKTVSVVHGDHSFLMFVFTDGGENASISTPDTLRKEIQGLPENWTVAALVPNALGVSEAKNFGFPSGNIETWNTQSADGGTEVVSTITRAADTFLTSRSTTGLRGTKTLFADSSVVNAKTVEANLVPADPSTYFLHLIPPVTTPFPKAMKYRAKFRLDDYVTNKLGRQFVVGHNYYELIKSEEVGPTKDIAVMHKQTDKVYIGREARDLIGLPKHEKKRLRPGVNEKFRIFVRSDSTNRHMLEGQRLLIVK